MKRIVIKFFKRRLAALAAILLLAEFTIAQVNISGIVNNYYEVISVDFCNNLVGLPLIPTGVNPGDRVLLIQMKGAEIDENDVATFGQILNFNLAGQYEFLTIATISSNIITFLEPMINNYDATGTVQLVYVPQYVDVSITGALTAPPWNGSTGGIVVLEATGTVTLNADIDVSGKGFSGGAVIGGAACYGGAAGYTGYRCDIITLCGGNKGEGITESTWILGRGPLANGGGGGNSHKTGGAGGANFGAGGLGGNNNSTNASCTGNSAGIGGNSLSTGIVMDHAFFGGGGGSGHQSSGGASAGGNGGGIVIIRANTINGNARSILANGTSPSTIANNDAAGGGGAGGSILLEVGTINGGLICNANAGAGGSVNSAVVDSCMGPGGGGGGGLVWTSSAAALASITANNNAGANGVNLGAGPCLNAGNGSAPGQAGTSLSDLLIANNALVFIPLTLQVSNDTIICLETFATLSASGTGTGTLTFQWSDGQTGSSIQVSPGQYTTYTVSIFDSRGCSITEEVSVDVMSITASVSAVPTSIILGESVQLDADVTGVASFSWDPSDYLDNPLISNPIATPDSSITYCITITGNNGCTDTACVYIDVFIPEPAIHFPNAFTPNGDGLNDDWQPIVHPCYDVQALYVFDRWGETVLSWSIDGQLEWDGTNHGVKEPIGTYVYYAIAKCNQRTETEFFKGTITLIR